MTIVDCLKQIVTTLGGTTSASDDTVSELLEQINNAFENGGGGTVFVPFTVTVDETTGDISASTTAVFADVKAAVAAGKNVVADVSIDAIAVYAALSAKSPTEDPNVLTFSAVLDISDSEETPKPQLMQIGFAANGATATVVNLAVAT